mgnify:FL=1
MSPIFVQDDWNGRALLNFEIMEEEQSQSPIPRIDIPSMEADMAFFEARLSLAEHADDTAYQRAQVKAYQTLGRLIGDTLARLRTPRPTASDNNNAAA